MPPIGFPPRRLPSLALFCGLALLLSICGCTGAASRGDETEKEAASRNQEVPVVTAGLRIWPQTVRVQGSLLGNEQAVVGARVAGLVETVNVDLGSVVQKGDPLVMLDCSDLELRVRQTEAQLRQACAAVGLDPHDSETGLDREQAPPVVLERALLEEAEANVARGNRLLERRAINQEELDRLRTQWKTADARYRAALNSVGEQIALIGVRRAELALARQQLEDGWVVAPFDGIVERRTVAPGEHISVGQPVVTLVRTDTLRYTAGIPERAAVRVSEGQPVRIYLEGESEPLETTVSRVSPAVTQSNRSLSIEADVPNSAFRWRAGLFAEAEITVDEEAESLTVPASAVTEFAGIEKVWLVREGEAAEQPVRTGRRNAQWVEILDGLSGGDLIVSRSEEGRSGAIVAIEVDNVEGPAEETAALANGSAESGPSE